MFSNNVLSNAMSKQTDRAVFGQLVTRVARHVRRALDEELCECGLSQATALPLLVLSRAGPNIRQGVIAEELGIEGPSLVRVVDLLIGEGLLTRREDPSDRRAKLLKLTARGEERVLEIETAAQRMRGRMFADVASADLAIAVGVLSKIEQSLLRDWDS
jgi:MarR family transcriptional regulator for hemolysin